MYSCCLRYSQDFCCLVRETNLHASLQKPSCNPCESNWFTNSRKFKSVWFRTFVSFVWLLYCGECLGESNCPQTHRSLSLVRRGATCVSGSRGCARDCRRDRSMV